jgi:hypothetical protein
MPSNPTIWSYLLWAFSAWCIWQLFAMIRNYHRAQAVAVVVEEIAEIAEAEHVVSPPATPPPAPHRKTVVAKSGVTDSGLIIPSHTQRRVRRGGETLSGVPITDRRARGPHTPGLTQSTSTPEIDNLTANYNKENTPWPTQPDSPPPMCWLRWVASDEARPGQQHRASTSTTGLSQV